MAWKGRIEEGLDYDRLKSLLSATRARKEDNNLYAVTLDLINAAAKFQNALSKTLTDTSELSVGQLVGRIATKNGGTFSDRYSPFLTLVANASGAGVDYLYFNRSGDKVDVVGRVQITPTAIGVDTELRIELPIISYFKFDYQLAGVAFSPTVNQGAAIIADVGNNAALLKFLSTSNATFDLFFNFGYTVIEKT